MRDDSDHISGVLSSQSLLLRPQATGISCSNPEHNPGRHASPQLASISTAQQSESCTNDNPSRAPPLSNSMPIRGVSIPDLGHGIDAWRRAIKQWEEPDAGTGLAALKDWPAEWYTGVMRPHMASKRTIRKTIAAEYIRSVIHHTRRFIKPDR